MKSPNVVVAQYDAKKAEMLAASLHTHFRNVSVARTLEELRKVIPRQRADVAIVDLELVSLPELEQLHRDFTATNLVCTHRVPDEDMWTSALNAGAADVCENADVAKVVAAALRSLGLLSEGKAA